MFVSPRALSEYQEADFIAQFIKATLQGEHPLKETAILYRTHFQSRAIEEALVKYALPYTIIGGLEFYERKEIKDMLAYLRLLINPYDRVSFLRVINTPLRGIGDKAEEALFHHWQMHPFDSFDQVVQQCIEHSMFTGAKKTSLEAFITIFRELSATIPASLALQTLLERTNYYTYLKETYEKQEALDRIDNLKELYKAMVHAEEEKPTTITTFLDDVALMQAQSKAKGDSDAILLMTVHAAKGLEFNNIVIAGLEEGLFPSSRSLLDDNALEEERRLLYVGITRAKERLLLTYSRYRYTYGTMTDCRPSRFLSEIPSSLIQHLDCSYWTTEQLHATLCQWLKGATPAAVESRKKIVKAVEQKKEKIFTTAHKVTWKKNQPVTHTTFGVGVIKDIELKGNQKTYLTVSFKSGIKKVAAEFVTVV